MHKIKNSTCTKKEKKKEKKKNQWQYVFACVLFAYEVETAKVMETISKMVF